ncbi:MAG: YbaB/EbfC family nucleoid-associated protein [Rhodospirillaceae bacterium]|nr:YbaB/EbfC family nucleoid-associated protein [Rhodospirillaceae bacterium]HAA92679.1 YbaB/EbfC family nucleoid-associated protein [Rhodospirillaceae bacterium]|tara:strand:- start:15 stop:338 length:324 start_codon:yes stop_codon:yes gene_type:complete
MKNLGQLMKQAQEMQEKMGAFQESLAELEVSGASGGGLVTLTLNGKGEMRGVKVDPSLIDPAEAEILEDLIIAAHNDAKTKVEQMVQEKTSEMMGGLELPPGMKLPF